MLDRTRIVVGAAVIWMALLSVPAMPVQGQAAGRPKIIRVDPEKLKKTRRGGKAAAKTRPATRPAKADSVEACAKLFKQGRYAEAVGGYTKLIAGKVDRVPAAVGLARALAATGQYEKGVEALKSTESAGAKRADWHLTMAECLGKLGQYTSALAHAVKANELRAKWAPTILARGRLLEVFGRKKEALAVYKSIENVVAEDDYLQDPPSLVAIGRILDRWSILSKRKASEQANSILHNYLQRAYQDVDKSYWPAHVAAGELLLSKHRVVPAVKEFQLALKLNKRAADAHVGMGIAALSKWRFETCMKMAAEALKVNSRHDNALLLKAICLMQWRKFDQVPPVLKKVLAVNPNHVEALSLMAAVHIRTRQADKAKPFIQRVGKINPSCAILPNTIGQWLAAGRQFAEAQKYYTKAIALAPELAGPVANLGKLYMQTGQEDKAKEILEKAHKIDDFRQDVYNYLKLLVKMEKFRVRETPHFIVKVDPKHDAILLDQVAEYAEQMHKEVSSDFDHEPQVKTRVEIFPTHDQFSVRISGRGWIGTIGASTGTVIAMVAPNKERSQFGTFNWATVLRHEYTHTVTLSATGNRIPHWFTEACAVWQQPDRRNYEAVKKLVAAVRLGRLLPVKELDWGFIRPKRAGDRGLAYAQAEWIMEYIIETKGYDAISKMLAGFRDGWTQKEVFAKCVGQSEAKFDKVFVAWGKKQVRGWGFSPDAPPDLAKSTKAAKDKPTDAAAHADLALAQMMRGRRSSAEKSARKALELDAKNRRALGVLAMILSASKRYADAIRTAEKLENIDHTSRIAPRVLAQCHQAKRSWAKAISALELLKGRMPLDKYAFERLATIYTLLGQPTKALPNLIEMHRRSMKDPQYARRIAETYRSMGQDDLALEYFRQIARINPYEASAYEAIASIHRSASRYGKAIAAIDNVCILQPKSADAWAKMAMMRYLAGKAARDRAELGRARKAAEKAVGLDPESQAKQIIEYIDAVLESLGPPRAT